MSPATVLWSCPDVASPCSEVCAPLSSVVRPRVLGSGPRFGAAPPGSGRFPAARFSRMPHPLNFWVVLQENGPEFDVSPEFWAVSPALHCDSRRRLRHNPRSGAPASPTPRFVAYETAQNFARAIETARCSLTTRGKPSSRGFPPSFVTYETAQNFACALAARSFSASYPICARYARCRDASLPTSGTCTAIGCRCWRRGGSRCRWAHRIAARFRVRRRNPADQARDWRSRVAFRR